MTKKVVQFLDFKTEYDFLLLGIYCAYRDYRICFELNHALELSFEKQDDFEIQLEKKELQVSSLFFWLKTVTKNSFLL